MKLPPLCFRHVRTSKGCIRDLADNHAANQTGDEGVFTGELDQKDFSLIHNAPKVNRRFSLSDDMKNKWISKEVPDPSSCRFNQPFFLIRFPTLITIPETLHNRIVHRCEHIGTRCFIHQKQRKLCEGYERIALSEKHRNKILQGFCHRGRFFEEVASISKQFGEHVNNCRSHTTDFFSIRWIIAVEEVQPKGVVIIEQIKENNILFTSIGREAAENIGDCIAMRIKETQAPTSGNILQNEIDKECCFPAARLADDIEALEPLFLL